MNGFVARLGLAIGIVTGNSLIVMHILGDVTPSVNAALIVLSLAGFAAYVINPSNGE